VGCADDESADGVDSPRVNVAFFREAPFASVGPISDEWPLAAAPGMNQSRPSPASLDGVHGGPRTLGESRAGLNAGPRPLFAISEDEPRSVAEAAPIAPPVAEATHAPPTRIMVGAVIFLAATAALVSWLFKG
jgi:hypothetical protein